MAADFFKRTKKGKQWSLLLAFKNESEDNDSGIVTGPAGNSSKFLKIIFARS